MEESNKIHFHSFDALRFFAFLKVFIFHIPLYFIAESEPVKAWYSDHIRHGGGIGVSFFFVLSGFLITYILTAEKLKTGRINLKRFFIRRAIRIWPLFYLVVIFALLVPADFAREIGFYTNGGGYVPDWRFSLTFTENYKSILMDQSPKTTPLPVLWSLCIEVHFYLFWMLVIFFIKRKAIPYFLALAIIASWFFRAYDHDLYNNEIISNSDLFTNLDYFAISGLLGYFVAANYKKVVAFSLKIPLVVKYLYFGLVVLMLLNLKTIFMHDLWFIKIFRYTIDATVFTLLLFLFIPFKVPYKISEKNIFTKLGKMCYGMYVYHIIWIHVILKVFKNNDIVLDNWPAYILFATITFLGTTLTSYLSYRYFEMPILKLKNRFFSGK